MPRRRRTLTVAIAIAAGAAGAAFATAAATSTSATTIQACQNDTNGLLRVVNDGSGCRTGETALSWNVQGPPGEQGPPGPAGPPGAGGPLAFAHVLADGTLDASRTSDNVLSVARTLVSGSTGCGGTCGLPVYCFDLGVQPKNAVATVESSLVENPPFPGFPQRSISLLAVNATVQPAVAADWGCSAATDAAVIIGGTGPGGEPFYVEFN